MSGCAATPSPGLSPMHRSPAAKAASPFPPEQPVLSEAAGAVSALSPAMMSEPGTPVGQAVPEHTDVTALLLGDSLEPLNGAPNGAR